MGQAGAFAPRLHELRDQLPLRAARILEFVDQDVLIPLLEQVAAAREVLHVAEQRERPRQQLRKVEHGALVERAAVPVERDRVELPHALREHDVERGVVLLDDAMDVAGDVAHREVMALLVETVLV